MDITLLPERFRSKIRISHESHNGLTGCWEWIAGRWAGSDYARYTIDGTPVCGHRAAYHWLVDRRFPIRVPGKRVRRGTLTIDHLCRNRPCVNPAHMEVVLIGINIRRGDGPAAKNHRKRHCLRGHTFTAENTLPTKDGGRVCRACKLETGRTQRLKDPGAARQRCRQWYWRNAERERDRRREYSREYRARNREQVRAKDRARRKAAQQPA